MKRCKYCKDCPIVFPKIPWEILFAFLLSADPDLYCPCIKLKLFPASSKFVQLHSLFRKLMNRLMGGQVESQAYLHYLFKFCQVGT